MDDFDRVMETLSLDSEGLSAQYFSFASGVHILFSAVMGFLVLLVYYMNSTRENRDRNLFYVIPVLSILMTVIMRIEGTQVALFFGIFGILSIVRFRSELTDQKGITFILFAVIEGVLVGVNAFVLALLACLVVSLSITLARYLFRSRSLYRLSVRIGEPVDQARARIEAFLSNEALEYRLQSVSHAMEQNGKTQEWSAKNRLEYSLAPDDEMDFAARLPAIDQFFMDMGCEIEIRRNGDTV